MFEFNSKKRQEEKMRKKRARKKRISKAIGWSLSVFFMMFLLVYGINIGTILTTLMAVLVAPIPAIQNLWKNLLKTKRASKLKGVILFVLLIVAMGALPDVETEMPSDKESSYEIEFAENESNVNQEDLENSETSEENKNTELPKDETTEDTKPEEIVIPKDSTFSVKFIDVDQADAALIECDGHYMLIDGGNKEDSDLIYTVLKEENIRHLDIMVGTHVHEDHIGGLPGALNYATTDLILSPVTSYDSKAFVDFVKYANKNGNGLVIPSVGNKYMLGSAEITILGLNAGTDVNDTSIVLSVKYGLTTFLFTGDAEREAEQAILNAGFDLSSTVLKVGHHGSENSTTYPFLREIMPQYAVISVGKNNTYNHPTDNTLSRLRDAGVTVFRTDLNGDVFFVSDGENVSVSVEKEATYEQIMTPGKVVQNNSSDSGNNESSKPSNSTTNNNTGSSTNNNVGVTESSSETDYIANTNTKKFHYPTCSSVKKMKKSNKWYYSGTRDELIGMGYDSCGNCHP